MKTGILLFAFGVAALQSHAINYYVAANGSNSNSGTSKTAPFQTIAAFNTITLAPGDSILFRRGDVFRGQLTIKQSGTAANPIVVGAYGTGNRPIIGGSETVTNFVSAGTNIYSANFSSNPPAIFYNGSVNFPARFPNSGFLTIDTHTDTTSFYDAALNQASGYWNGATVHNRVYAWQYTENKVQSFSGGTVTLQPSSIIKNLQNGWGYYFSDKFELLDTAGEFYYNPSLGKLYVYASSKPNNAQVEASFYDYGVYLQAASYVTILNISFLGQKNSGVSSTNNTTNVTISNCKFSSIYGKAISLNAVNNVTISDNDIADIFSKGIVANESPNITVQGNSIKRIGLYPGRATEKSEQQISYSGMEVEGNITSGNISLNTLDSIGYNGIRFSINTLIEKNTVTNYCFTTNDGGGLYTFQGTSTVTPIRGTGCSLKNNIIKNGIGNTESTVGIEPSANGIYMDDASGGTTMIANTISNASAAGIFLNGSPRDTIQNNVIFNCLTSLRMVKHRELSVPIANCVVNNNVFYLLKKDAYNLSLTNYIDTSFNFASYSGNYYNNPYSDAVISRYLYPQSFPPDSILIFSAKQWKATNDLTAKGSYVRWNDYKVTDTIGGNLLTNGTFNTTKDYWFCYNPTATCLSQWETNSKLDGGSLHVQCNNGVAYNTLSFALTANQKYQLSFSSNATKDENIVVRTNQNGPNYGALDFVRTFAADTGRHENIVAFNSNYSYAQSRINLYVTKNAPDFWIDNAALYKVNATYDDPLGRNFLYTNTNSTSQTFSFSGTLYDLNNNAVTGSITLAPFTSQILLKKDGASSTAKVSNAVAFKKGADLSVYPNPAKDFVMISSSNPGKQIDIFDVSGRRVLEVNSNGTSLQKINVSKLSHGMYFIVSGTVKTMFLKQ